MHSYLSHVRQTVQRPWITMGLGCTILFLIGSRAFKDQQPSLQLLLPCMGLLLIWLASELYRGISHYWAAGRGFDRDYASFLGLGFALLGTCGILLQLTGGLFSPFYPLTFLCIAFLASIGTPRQGALWFGYAFILEVASIVAMGPHKPGILGLGFLHLFYIAAFAASHHLYLHGMLRELSEKRNRKRNLERVSQRTSELQEHRATPSSEGMTAVSLASIDHDQHVLLSRLKDGLDAHGCALLWLDSDGSYFEVAGIETDAIQFDTGPFPVHSGVPASLFKGESSLRLSRSGESTLHLPYYGPEVRPRSWLAIPIEQKGTTRGALCVDRIHPVPFSTRDELLLEATAAILSRALENERALLHSSHDLESLAQVADIGYILSETASKTLLVDQIIELATHIVPFDWAFLSSVDLHDQTHTVLATTSEVEHLHARTFPFAGSLFSLANKHKCMLPERGMLRTSGPLISTEDPSLPELASLCILPLIQKNESIGCLVMASQDPQLFADKEREKKLTIFAQQAGSALANVDSSERITELGVRDSLTGLENHSTLMERLHQVCSATELEHGTTSPACLLMFNLDDFRRINHRYDYTTGDRVLQRVAKALRDVAEPQDIVARYSGEEFVMFCAGFDIVNGLKFVDSICHQIEQLEFCSEGPETEMFSVTISAGLAAFPMHASDADTLLHHAIEAMLQAKQRGGNQAVLYDNDADGIVLATPNPDVPLSVTPPNGWGWGSLPPSEDPQRLQDPKYWSLASFGTRHSSQKPSQTLLHQMHTSSIDSNIPQPEEQYSDWMEEAQSPSE